MAVHYEPQPMSDDDIVRALVSIREQRAELAVLAANYEQELFDRGHRGSWIVEGVGEVAVRKATKRARWDNEGLTRVVVSYALDERKVNEETGEYEAGWEAVARVLSECARPSWRVTPLRARGIQIDEYCEETPGDLTLQLPPREGL